MSKHTPGPWKAVVWGTANRIVSADLVLIAETPRHRNADADANLIAAAPELLDALTILQPAAEIAWECIQLMKDGNDDETTFNRLRAARHALREGSAKARDVIAKAEGK